MTKDSVLVFRVSDHHTLVRDSLIGEATINLADVVALNDGKSSSTQTLSLSPPASNVPSVGKYAITSVGRYSTPDNLWGLGHPSSHVN